MLQGTMTYINDSTIQTNHKVHSVQGAGVVWELCVEGEWCLQDHISIQRQRNTFEQCMWIMGSNVFLYFFFLLLLFFVYLCVCFVWLLLLQLWYRLGTYWPSWAQWVWPSFMAWRWIWALLWWRCWITLQSAVTNRCRQMHCIQYTTTSLFRPT